MPEPLGQLGTEVKCAAVLEQLRWLRGVHRPHCGEVRHGVLRVWARRIFPCGGCRPQFSLIGGTVFQGTNLALTVWYLAIYFISQAKTSLSAPVPGFTRKSVATWASALVCDWRSCFGGITDAGRQHRPVVAAAATTRPRRAAWWRHAGTLC
ncbi:transposase [Thiocystis minor]|uniref:transposase n=1 Tax=Thiocystis minor TaxID=61597 RepID=UPI0019144E8E